MLQNLQNFAKFQKLQLDNLVDFEKCWKTRILNYFLANIASETAENEQHFAEILLIGRRGSEWSLWARPGKPTPTARPTGCRTGCHEDLEESEV